LAVKLPHPPGSYREILAVSLPVIAGMAAQTVMMFCDRIFLARHSVWELQAALPAGILAFTLISVFQGTAGYASTFVAQNHGAGNRNGVAVSYSQGVFLALFSAPILLLIGVPGQEVLKLGGHPAHVLALEEVYFRWMIIAGVGATLNAGAASLWSGLGRTTVTMAAGMAGAALNVFLDWILIFGRFGFPEMGIEGAGIATAISSFVPGLVLISLSMSGKIAREFPIRSLFRFSATQAWKTIRYGLPSAISVFMDVASFSVFVFLTGRLSPVEFTASNIAFGVNNLAFHPLLGFSIATTILVGRYRGAGDSRMAARVTRRTLVVALLYFSAIALTFLLLPGFYMNLFRSPEVDVPFEQLKATGSVLLAILCMWGGFDAVSLMLGGALRGAGDTRFVMLLSTCLGWLFWIPGIFLLYRGPGTGVISLWLFTTLYIALLAVGYFVRYKKGPWRTIVLVEHGDQLPIPVAEPAGRG
jgi:MATE family multidrug resistance protein